MIQPNELRIGNYIYEPNSEDKDPFKVWAIYSESGNEKINGYPISYFKPILIAPEILEKCGFKKLWHLSQYEYTISIDEEINTLHFVFHGSEVFCCLSISEDNYDENINVGTFTASKALSIQFLHQLQNLYFALTGDELEINLL